MEAAKPTLTRRLRQLRLFEVGNPWAERFGVAFFRELPLEAGVYYFYDGEGKLLYLGQSHSLRHRIGSYRHVHPERHARRTLRLVHRVHRIEWEICASAEHAILRERELLLSLRPPFNRAGVWLPPPWWLGVEAEGSEIRLMLSREAIPEGMGYGPFRSGFPYVYASLVRLMQRQLRPQVPFADYPAGFLQCRRASPAVMRGETSCEAIHQSLEKLLTGKADDLLVNSEQARSLLTGGPLFEERLWDADLELVRDYYQKHLLI